MSVSMHDNLSDTLMLSDPRNTKNSSTLTLIYLTTEIGLFWRGERSSVEST